MTTTRRAALLGGACALLATPALAHRVKRVESEVVFRDDGSVSVTHVYHAQDAQDALFGAGLIDKPDIAGLRERAKLALYTGETFALTVGGEVVPLDVLGAELLGNSVYVYQEADAVPDGTVAVRAAMLHGLLFGQINSVTVVRGDKRETRDLVSDKDEAAFAV